MMNYLSNQTTTIPILLTRKQFLTALSLIKYQVCQTCSTTNAIRRHHYIQLYVFEYVGTH